MLVMTPLVLIAGFLGAGKTTLIRKLLPELVASGCRPHVILNDYRNANVDAATLEQYRDLVNPIAGTCVCCGSRDVLLQILSEMETSEESIVLLEANGTADTAELIDLLSTEDLCRRYSLPIQISVVNVNRWQRRIWRRLERLQVQTAGFVHLTHAQNANADRIEHVQQHVQSLAPQSTLAEVHDLATFLAEQPALLAPMPPRTPIKLDETNSHHHHHDPTHHAEHHFSSLEVELPTHLSRETLVTWLEAIQKEVVRIKGVAFLQGEERPCYFERLEGSRRINIRTLDAPWNAPPVAVLIGAQIDAPPIQNALKATCC
jgi:G3E family GTPase